MTPIGLSIHSHRGVPARGGWRGLRPAMLAAGAVLLLISTGAPARAQEPEQTAPAATEVETVPPPSRVFRTTGSRVGIGRSIVVAHDEEVRDAVVVIGGSARIDGRVRDGVVVIGGDVELGPEADIRGDITLVGGALIRASGARLGGAVSNVYFGSWWPWSSAGDDAGPGHRSFGRGWDRIDRRAAWSWLVLAAASARVAVLAILMAFVLFVARGRVARVGRAAGAEPGRALLVGLAAELLFVPVLLIISIALALTIVGIPIAMLLVPLAMLAAMVTSLLGFTAVTCRFGEWLEDRLGVRVPSSLFATALGFLVIVGPAFLARLLLMAPAPLGPSAVALLAVAALVEIGVWTIGLGAALMTGFGRWATTPPPIPAA